MDRLYTEPEEKIYLTNWFGSESPFAEYSEDWPK